MENFNILEFGSGASTIYWASRFAFIEVFESDSIWFLKVKNASEKISNIDVHRLTTGNPSKKIESFSKTCLKVFTEDLLRFPELNFDFEEINFKLICECISRSTYFFVDGVPKKHVHANTC